MGARLSLSSGPACPWAMGAIFSVWCLPSDRGYLQRVSPVLSLGFQLEQLSDVQLMG